ncbi:MAG: hypothetical protein NC123_11195 [Butyrivibrio sp.]|nr:hypothetical protein [Acetatifactor muris]MCM1560089.1 hypothetical protein [Butyrivibrio sp.]
MAKLRLGIYAAAHFLVDLGCALLLLGRICPDWNPGAAILLYNLFAFAVQMPIGLLADRLGRCHLFASAGCLLVLSGWALPPGLAAVTAAGLGNAAFHVGGGLNTLNESGRRAGPLGLFVSPGAFGVYLGGILAFSERPGAAAALPLTVCAALAAAAVILRRFGRGTDNAELAMPRGGFTLWGGAACLLLVVIFRSLLGLAANLPWRADFGWLAVCAVAGGKAAGGYLADRFGMFPTAMTSLCLSAVCFLGGSYPAAGLGALFLFNVTMPLTLWAMARLFPGMKGFSFGLLTFGLFLGFLPVYFEWGSFEPAALAAGTFLSLPPLIWGLRQAEGRKDGVS